MGIKGKWEMLFRLLGNILFLIGIIITIILDFYIVQNLLVYFLLVLSVGLHFSLILGFKLDFRFLDDNRLTILTIITIITSILLLIGSILSQRLLKTPIFLFLTLSNSLGMICWDFSLSLFKKKKIMFIIGSLVYISTSFFFRFLVLMKTYGFIGLLLPLIFTTIGIGTILSAEIKLIKKKLLKYI
ncbi:hypothetical protein LCGC14_0755310 [marine sediment metagenome]|uniref:Uncharacterized protein n=1 Tax=marine sediment metagenome TaxID=412755 RepID=A0A0F9SN11_9ZZZZ